MGTIPKALGPPGRPRAFGCSCSSSLGFALLVICLAGFDLTGWPQISWTSMYSLLLSILLLFQLVQFPLWDVALLCFVLKKFRNVEYVQRRVCFVNVKVPSPLPPLQYICKALHNPTPSTSDIMLVTQSLLEMKKTPSTKVSHPTSLAINLPYDRKIDINSCSARSECKYYISTSMGDDGGKGGGVMTLLARNKEMILKEETLILKTWELF